MGTNGRALEFGASSLVSGVGLKKITNKISEISEFVWRFAWRFAFLAISYEGLFSPPGYDAARLRSIAASLPAPHQGNGGYSILGDLEG